MGRQRVRGTAQFYSDDLVPPQSPARRRSARESGVVDDMSMIAQPDRGEHQSRLTLFKLAFNSEWGVLVGGEAYVQTAGDVGRFEGVGDTNVTLKRAWIVDDATAFGMEFNITIPTAATTPLGSGKTDYEINTIYSQDFGPVHMDGQPQRHGQLGQVDLGSARTQFGGATAFSLALARRPLGPDRRGLGHAPQRRGQRPAVSFGADLQPDQAPDLRRGSCARDTAPAGDDVAVRRRGAAVGAALVAAGASTAQRRSRRYRSITSVIEPARRNTGSNSAL